MRAIAMLRLSGTPRRVVFNGGAMESQPLSQGQQYGQYYLVLLPVQEREKPTRHEPSNQEISIPS